MIIISRNSLIYRLANVYGNGKYATDICEFRMAVFKGLISCGLLVVFGAALLSPWMLVAVVLASGSSIVEVGIGIAIILVAETTLLVFILWNALGLSAPKIRVIPPLA